MGFRYNVERGGRMCCRSNDIRTLCAECRKVADSCTCNHCAEDRGGTSRHLAAQPRAAASTPDTPPPPPSLIERIRTLHGRENRDGAKPREAAVAGGSTPASGVPSPPDLYAAIRNHQGGDR